MKQIEVSKLYSQEPDCCSDDGPFDHQIRITTQNGGGGSYLIIETARWALDSDEIDAFAQLLKDVLKEVEG